MINNDKSDLLFFTTFLCTYFNTFLTHPHRSPSSILHPIPIAFLHPHSPPRTSPAFHSTYIPIAFLNAFLHPNSSPHTSPASPAQMSTHLFVLSPFEALAFISLLACPMRNQSTLNAVYAGAWLQAFVHQLVTSPVVSVYASDALYAPLADHATFVAVNVALSLAMASYLFGCRVNAKFLYNVDIEPTTLAPEEDKCRVKKRDFDQIEPASTDSKDEEPVVVKPNRRRNRLMNGRFGKKPEIRPDTPIPLSRANILVDATAAARPAPDATTTPAPDIHTGEDDDRANNRRIENGFVAYLEDLALKTSLRNEECRRNACLFGGFNFDMVKCTRNFHLSDFKDATGECDGIADIQIGGATDVGRGGGGGRRRRRDDVKEAIFEEL